MNEKKVIKDYGSRAVRQSWNSFFVGAKIDMFHWQALSELIANTILKNSSEPISILIRHSYDRDGRANFIIIQDDSCGVKHMTDRYDGIWSEGQSYDKDKFVFSLNGSGLNKATFSLGRLKVMTTKTIFDENLIQVRPDLSNSNGLYNMDDLAIFNCTEVVDDSGKKSGTKVWIDTNRYEDKFNPCVVNTADKVKEHIGYLQAVWAPYLETGQISIVYQYSNVSEPGQDFTKTLTPEFPLLAHHSKKDDDGFPVNEWEYENERIETEVNGKKVYVNFTIGRLLNPEKCVELGRSYDVDKKSPFYYSINNAGIRIRQNGRIMTKPLSDFWNNSGRASVEAIIGFIDIEDGCGVQTTVTKTAPLSGDNWNAIVDEIKTFMKDKGFYKRVSKNADPVHVSEAEIRNQIADYLETSYKEVGLYNDVNVHKEYALPTKKAVDIFAEDTKDSNKSVLHEVKLDAFSTDDFDAVLMYIFLTGITKVRLWSQTLTKSANMGSILDVLKKSAKDNFGIDLDIEHRDYRKIPGIKT